MLTPRELRDMQRLVTRIQRGSVSRRDWAMLAAYTLIYQGEPVVAGIAAGGYEQFKATAGPIWEGHAFKDDDIRAIYSKICVAASRAAAAPSVN